MPTNHIPSQPPEGWRVTTLGEIADVRYGKANPHEEGPYPVVGSGGVFASSEEPLVPFATVVIGRKGSAGTVWLMEQPSFPSDTTFFFDWKTAVDPRYVHAWLTIRPLSGQHAKTTLPSLQRPDIERHEIWLPPLPEQRAIADVLSAVRRAIEATEAVIEAVRDLNKSLVSHVFSNGLVHPSEANQVAHQPTDVGPAPREWKAGRLGEFVTLQRGFDLPASQRRPGAIPVVSSSGVSGSHTEARADGEGVVIGRYGSIGNVQYIEGPYWPLNTTLFVLDFKGNNPKFVSYFLGRIDYKSFNDKTSVPGVNRNHLHQILAAFPSLEGQQSISRLLSRVDVKLSAENARKFALQALFASLSSTLMTGQVRVGTPEAAEEC